jgi:CDP-diacylglycerol--glycerol-3-phosphate 3-phosphatidyltransferase
MATDLQPTTSPNIFNVPNQLSAARLVLAIAVFVLIPWKMYLAAFVVFVIAASTDWVDGYWARRFKQVTKVGRILDPFVDKIIICGTFIFLAVEPNSGIAAWMAVVVVGRELLVTALRSVVELGGGDFSAKWAAKCKMFFQCVAAGASLVVLMKLTSNGGAPLEAWLSWTLVISVWLAVLTTIYSGLEYVFVAAKHLRG